MYQDFDNKKSEEYLNAFKQKVAEQKIATMEERRHEMARSRNNFLGTLAGAALAIAVGWFILMPQYQQTNKEIPTIRRSQTAMKIKPENPGGMEIPNQDKDVYNLVEKKEVDNTVVENLLPTPEKPKLPDIVPETTEVNAEAVADNAEVAVPTKPEDLLSDVAKETSDEAKAAEEKAKAEAKAAEEKAKAEAKAAEEKAKAEAKAAEEKAKAEAKAAEEKAKAEAKVAENAVAKSVAGGKWQVQFVASKNKDAVEKTWTSLTQKYSMLQAYTHEVQKADLGAQGIVYRLRAGSFATREEAAKVCSALKAKGMNDCIVKER